MRTIDAVVTLHTPEIVAMRGDWYRRFLSEKIGARPGVVDGVSIDHYVAVMDDAGVDLSLLIATKEGSSDHRISFHTPLKPVAEAVARHPDRFRGLVGVDPTQGMRALRELETAVRDHGFVGAHLYPHWFELPPDHARYYPVYAKCAELGVPVQMQVGHCLRYSDERPLRSVGFPRCLDKIACDFPELAIIGIHIGYPWTDEMLSVAWKHPNVYVCGDAYAPKHWPEAFVRFADTWGRSKVLFGTDFPVIEPKRATDEVAALGLREESLRALLGDNAARVYRLDER